jgi:hypothetical protein
MSPRAPHRPALSSTLAHGVRMQSTRIPDPVLAAARDEHAVRKLERRIARWRRFRRVW